MKINGPNQSDFNPYHKQQIPKQLEVKREMKKDQLEISSEAKQLHKGHKENKARTAHIERLKAMIESGDYKVSYDQTAQKMIDFFSGK
ncbi:MULTISPECIES: flagellar biosynthesis anti-sigma factor FlgM [Clostridia]|uniref:flagellar biosynthesis anti-sigma factor FlgM n=1 Tax=Clostridia TaxID=186801 RepID=UPI000EA30870|nr:flagellar biosynthesis anti-sigma factor FlgM [Clostridium sp. 1xD42-85]NBJ69595.1 flagellar biosynthesis anti-sigma factor FlgM [Roseburia sp. 1XD42-34]RKI78344.1 flagellar biosynthesis anti-sigma factor FlgM [Clostridium sp. 1xD42-85]